MGAFDLFVILGAMRTGSNFLEESLNAAPGLTCHGEAFNPVFLAYPDRAELFGLTQSDRDADPLALLARLRDAPGLNGFRYFPDHDPRVLEPLLADPRCAKIVLGRNPLDSYLSLQIARETKQWRLKGADRKTARVRFDGADFLAYLEDHAAFHTHVARALQVTGQTAFPVSYDDLGDAAVLTGLLRFLGVGGEAAPTRRTVPQNPEPASEKVSNPAELARMVARLDAFRLGHLPSFEPDRGPGVRSFVTVAGARLIYMPIPGVEDRGLRAHLAGQGATESGLTQADLRVWMRDNPGFRSLTLIDHPLPRAWGGVRAPDAGRGRGPGTAGAGGAAGRHGGRGSGGRDRARRCLPALPCLPACDAVRPDAPATTARLGQPDEPSAGPRRLPCARPRPAARRGAG